MLRRRLRTARLGLPTVLGLRPGGYFIPYRHAGAGTRTRADYPALAPRFAAAEPAFAGVFAAIEGFSADLARIAAGSGPARFDQDWFPRLDAAAAYALVRRERPARLVEIGSGHSTRFLARAVADGGLATTITCIDPNPRARLDGLAVRHVPELLSEADPALLAALGPGDVLFVDSSHVAMPGSDVDRLLLDVLPRLAPGTLVHVHDVFLPDAYPEDWNWRGYNEQLLVGALLQGDGFEIVFASRYAATRMAARVEEGFLGRLPLKPGAHESSLWLRKR